MSNPMTDPERTKARLASFERAREQAAQGVFIIEGMWQNFANEFAAILKAMLTEKEVKR